MAARMRTSAAPLLARRLRVGVSNDAVGEVKHLWGELVALRIGLFLRRPVERHEFRDPFGVRESRLEPEVAAGADDAVFVDVRRPLARGELRDSTAGEGEDRRRRAVHALESIVVEAWTCVANTSTGSAPNR